MKMPTMSAKCVLSALAHGKWHYVNNVASALAKLTFVFSLISPATCILAESMLQEQEAKTILLSCSVRSKVVFVLLNEIC